MATVSQSPAAVAGPPVAQPVLTPLTASAIILVLTLDGGGESVVHDLLADLSGLARTVGFRSPEGGLAVVAGVGSAAWDRLFTGPRPAELHPFRALDGGRHQAVATPGDLLFHIRAATMDLCWELASLVVGRLAGAATVVDEVHGFKYFDERDLLGFVDGTENPTGPAAEAAVTIGPEDPAFAGLAWPNIEKAIDFVIDFERGARGGIEFHPQAPVIGGDIGARVGSAEETEEAVVVRQVLESADLEPPKRDMGAVEIDRGDAGRIGREVGEDVAAAGGNGDHLMPRTDVERGHVDDRVLPDLRIDEALERQREQALEHACARQRLRAMHRSLEPRAGRATDRVRGLQHG